MTETITVGDTPVSGLIFGYNAFSMIQNAVNAVAASGTVNVLATDAILNFQSFDATLKDQEELMRISGQMPGETSIEQQTASWQKAGQILEQIETPIQKYNTGLAVLKHQHRLDHAGNSGRRPGGPLPRAPPRL